MSFPSKFPPDKWFGEFDHMHYPANPYCFDFLLGKHGRVYKLIKAKQGESIKDVYFGCFLCRQWFQADYIEKHCLGKSHNTQFTFYTDQIHKYELINIDHGDFETLYFHMYKREIPAPILELMDASKFKFKRDLNLKTLYISENEDTKKDIKNEESYSNTTLKFNLSNKVEDESVEKGFFEKSYKRSPSHSESSASSSKSRISPSKSVSLSLPKPIPAPLPKPVPAPLQMTSQGKAPMAIVRPGAHTKLSQDPALLVNTTIPPPDISRPPPAPVPPPNLSKPPPNLMSLPVISSTSQANVIRPNVVDKEGRNLIFCQKDATMQNFFDRNKAHFIGLEYVVEINMDSGFCYTCRLCNNMLHPSPGNSSTNKLILHLQSFQHRSKYIKAHFPTLKEDSKIFTETALNNMVKDIEGLYGRMKVHCVGSMKYFKSEMADIDKVIKNGEHFVEGKEILDVVLHKKPLGLRAPLFGGFHRNPYYKKQNSDKLNEDHKNKNTSSEEIKKQDENNDRSKEEENKGEKSKIDTVESSVDDKRDMAESKDKTELSKEIIRDDEKKESGDQEQSELLDEPKLIDNTDALSDISLSDDNNEELSKLTKEEKHHKYREERKFRYELFLKEVDEMNEALDKSKNDMADKPTEHPDYAKEWAAFYKAKVAELRRKGFTSEGKDFKPEWIIHWSEYFETEFSKRRKAAKIHLMRKHKLLQRDIDEFEKADKEANKEPKKPVEEDLSPISDRGDADDLLDQIPVVADQIHRRRSRSPSPWEEQDLFSKSDYKSNTSTPVRDEWSPEIKRVAGMLPNMSSRRDQGNSSKAREVSPFSARLLNLSPSNQAQSYHNPSAFSSSERRDTERSQKRKMSPFSSREPKIRKDESLSKDNEEDKRSNISGNNDVNILSTLRLMAALEQAGFLAEYGKSIDEQIAIALGKENQAAGSSFEMINSKDCFKLLTLTRKKVQSILRAPDMKLKDSEIRVFRIILDNLIIFNQRSSLTEEDIADKPAVAAPNPQHPDDRTLKIAIAQAINKHLVSQGKSVSDTEFQQLIEAEFRRIKGELVLQGSGLGPVQESSRLGPGQESSRLGPGQESSRLGQGQDSSRSINPPRRSLSPASAISSRRLSPGMNPSRPIPGINPSRPSTDMISSAQSSMNPSRTSQSSMNPSRSSQSSMNPSRSSQSSMNPSRTSQSSVNSQSTQHVDRAGPSHSRYSNPNEPVAGPSRPHPGTSIKAEEDDFIEFTDQELISLLSNFKTLEPLEQKDLISHMKKLERRDPERVKRLKEAMHKK